MKRLTERDEYGNADIAELSDAMTKIYGCLSFDETNVLTTALNRLAAYEDTGLMPDDVEPTGIIIDHWEMPKSCNECPLLDWDWGSIKCKITKRSFNVDEEPFRERKVDDCPLVIASESKVKIDKELIAYQQEALESLEKLWKRCENLPECEKLFAAYNTAWRFINELPMRIEANEVARGKWIPSYDQAEYDIDGATPLPQPVRYQNGWECSLCGEWSPGMTNFCPNCGASMRENEE